MYQSENNGQGSRHNPIQVLSQEQEAKENQQKFQYEKNRHAIYRAHMGSRFDVIVAIIKSETKGTDQQKDKIIKERIRKFFSAKRKTINLQSEHFRQRREPNYSDPTVYPVQNQLIIFGADFLSCKQIKQKFIGLEVTVKFLDDSNCRVIFSSHQDAKRGLQMNLLNKSVDSVKLQQQNMQVPKFWFQLQPYTYLTFQRKLICRYAASNQNELQIKRSNDFYQYQQARKQFEQSLQQQFSQKHYYQVLRKYDLIGQTKMRQKMNNRGGNGYNRNDRYRDRDRERNQNQRGNNYERQGNQFRRDNRNYNNNDNFRNNRGNFNKDRYQDNDNYYQNSNRYRFNNNRDNRDNNFNNNNRQRKLSLSSQQDQPQNNNHRSRNKNHSNLPDFDNLSMISQSISQRSGNRNRNRKNQSSLSLSLHGSPQRNRNDQNQNQQDRNSQNFSFILGERELSVSGSIAVAKDMMNLSIGQNYLDCRKKGNDTKNNILNQKYNREQQLNLSIVSNSQLNQPLPSSNANKKNNKALDTSLLNDDNETPSNNNSNSNTKNKNKNDLNLSLLEQGKSNLYNQNAMKKKKVNTSIEQIQLYD